MTEKRCGVCRREACGWQIAPADGDPIAALKKQGVDLEDSSSVAAAIDEKKILLQRNHEKLEVQHSFGVSPELNVNTELEALIKEGHWLMNQLTILGVPEKEIEDMLHKGGLHYPNWGAE